MTHPLYHVITVARVLACVLAVTHLLGALWFSDPSRTAVQELYSFLPTVALLLAALVPDAVLKRLVVMRGLVVVLLAATIVQYMEAFLTSIGAQPHAYAALVRGLVILAAIVLVIRALSSSRFRQGGDDASTAQ
jgi:hypothetical protein